MSRLSISCFLPALVAALPLAAQAQIATDSVVRTTTVVTTTTTTVTKPASAATTPAAATTSSTSSTTSTTTAAPAARPPGPGDLNGARPKVAAARPVPAPSVKSKAASSAPARPTTATTHPAARPVPVAAARRQTVVSDPELAHMVQSNVDVTIVQADALPNLYERFLETTRAERRQWSAAKWTSASAALSRLNQRYEQVRTELSLEDKLNIRTLQGEFRALEAAKQVSRSL